ISILAAFVVGAAFTGGLGTLLPIMQVLVKNGSVQDWVNRLVVENRLDVRLVDNSHEVRIADITHKHDKDYNHFKTGQVLSLPGVLISLSVFGNIVRCIQEYLSEKAAILAIRDIRHHLYDHALHLPLGFFGQKGTSDVTSRLTQEAQGLQDGLKSLLGNSVQE